MRAAIITIVSILSLSVSAEKICGKVKTFSDADANMISFSIAVPGEKGFRSVEVPQKDIDRIRPLALAALTNPDIKVCVLRDNDRVSMELTNR